MIASRTDRRGPLRQFYWAENGLIHGQRRSGTSRLPERGPVYALLAVGFKAMESPSDMAGAFYANTVKALGEPSTRDQR